MNASNQITGAGFSYDAGEKTLADAATSSGDLVARGPFFDPAAFRTPTVRPQRLDCERCATNSACGDGEGDRVEKSSGKLYWYGTDGNVDRYLSDSAGSARGIMAT